MNRRLFLFVLCLSGLIPHVKAQNQNFTFVKSTIIKLEKYSTTSSDQYVNTSVLKKRMQGLFLIDSITAHVDYDSGKYVRFSSIPPADQFTTITEVSYGAPNYKEDMIVQNVKTKQLYAVMIYPMRHFQDHSSLGDESKGNGWLTKFVPKELTAAEGKLLSKYKSLITNAKSYMIVLDSIQKKYITRGYFDTARVTSADKNIYNTNLARLKETAEILLHIDRYEDKDNVVQDKLTMEEIASLSKINDWNLNQDKL